MTQTNIIVRLTAEGFHSWPQAAKILPEVAFLSDIHRHIFHIEARKKVLHSDRDVEIILFKRSIEAYLSKKYGSPCMLGAMSCEMIADELLKQFDLEYCSVLEDGENGAEIFKMPEQSIREIVCGPGYEM